MTDFSRFSTAFPLRKYTVVRRPGKTVSVCSLGDKVLRKQWQINGKLSEKLIAIFVSTLWTLKAGNYVVNFRGYKKMLRLMWLKLIKCILNWYNIILPISFYYLYFFNRIKYILCL